MRGWGVGAHIHQRVIPPPIKAPPHPKMLRSPLPYATLVPPSDKKIYAQCPIIVQYFFLIGSDLARLVSNILHCVLDFQMLFINKPFSLLSLEWTALLTIV